MTQRDHLFTVGKGTERERERKREREILGKEEQSKILI